MSQSRKNRSLSWKKRIFDFFTRKPNLFQAFHVSEKYLSGIALSKEKKIKSFFVSEIPPGIVKASFFKDNVHSQEPLLSAIRQGQNKLGSSSSKAALLLPEIAQKTFSFFFETLPLSQAEREKLIRFRIKKQLPLMPDDIRIAYDVFPGSSGSRVVASAVRREVVKEYEDLFDKAGIKIKMVSTPVAGLMNLLRYETSSDFLLLNVEEEAFSLAAVVSGEFSLYRQKPFGVEGTEENHLRGKITTVVKEIDNTINFIEDREERKIDTFWVRNGSSDRNQFMKVMTPMIRIPADNISHCSRLDSNLEEREQLAPLIGQLI